jgi:predicted amidohydrolase YtcJ
VSNQVFINGKVFTADTKEPFEECFVVEDGVISWIGKQEDLPETGYPVTDLGGKRVIPGLVDSHMHPVILADCAAKISCLPPKVHSIEELTEVIREKSSDRKPNQWIQGWGYDEEKFAEHRSPNRWDLDKATTEYPVELLRSCSHIRSVNSKALALAGITKDTPDPPGGEIDRDENGEPTGILKENARHLVGEILPEKSKEQVIESLVSLGELLLSQGIVAVTDMGNLDSVDYFEYYEEAAKRGFKQDVAMYYIWDLIRKNPEFKWSEEIAEPKRQIRKAGIKLIGDGSVGGRTAWMDRPYLGSDTEYGISVCSDEEVESAIAFCKKNHCQLSVHTMGKRAIDRMTEIACREGQWLSDKPSIRLEHITDPSEQAIDRAARENIAFSTQSIFMYAEIESYRNNLGMEWIKETYPIKRLLARGVKVALSTDAPATSWAEPSNPFPNIKCAVTRTAYDGTDCGRENCIDVETALRMYTKEGAEIAGFRNLGQLTAGYRASFAVISEDIFTIDPQRIDEIVVEKTYLDGDCVYDKMKKQ